MMVASLAPTCPQCHKPLLQVGATGGVCNAGHVTARDEYGRLPDANGRLIEVAETPAPRRNGISPLSRNGHNGANPLPSNGKSDFSRISAFPAQESVECAPPISLPPFPVDVLPPALGTLVRDGAAALGVPYGMIGTPLLAFAGATIGNTHTIQLKPGFVQRPSLYTANVAPPGSAKSPAQDVARYPLDVLQQQAYETFKERLAEYEVELQRWQDTPRTKRDEKPLRPAMRHHYSTDVTMEALGVMLGASPGIAVAQDEIVSWVKACDAYRGGRGGDRQKWLSLWAGSPLKVDRKSGDPLFVPHPCVCVIGGIQPELLPELADEAGRRDGFIERILWDASAAPAALWSEAQLSPAVLDDAVLAFAALRAGTSDRPVRLGPAARTLWVTWYDENANLVAETAGLTQGVYAKAPNQCARLCLILHCLAHPHEPATVLVSPETMADAIDLAEYYRAHAQHILPRFGAAPSKRAAGLGGRIERLLERAAGAWVPRAQINDGLGGHVPSAAITAALTALQDAGRVETRTTPTAGRPLEE
jgi:hypothetical protein